MSQATNQFGPISPDLLAILVCPRDKTKVELSEDQTKLVCTNPQTPHEYRIENGIPVMLVEED